MIEVEDNDQIFGVITLSLSARIGQLDIGCTISVTSHHEERMSITEELLRLSRESMREQLLGHLADCNLSQTK